ncbi:SDR family NAD(P)-dependent oxidoreductase [Parasphingorhabdus halotolerans]|uniref:SDR family oxidoreductase n=1 Tax=Parasphingorhabdus halotolerans TaxID=2725558 RepID=A0A6H2DKB8_9SPHN|nr:SDR family NAD(P)-dependent oxidoreductase [Parasphingorhabdus halotolerans]QJB69122.1 SDR family oxidoreductase [Parasphingorhabdus halotolerans]
MTTSNFSPNFSIDLTGRTAIVTGASAGLGRRFAKVLAACGAKVACTARRKDKLDELVSEITADGGTAAAFALDVQDADQLKAIIPAVTETLGQPDILVNNAGIVDAEHAVRMSTELIDDVLDTNLRSAYILSCEFARPLIEQKMSGRIVNIASIAATQYGGNGAALYSVTKAGIVRVTEALAVEWARFHINVNGIAPGLFNTDMSDGMIDRAGDFSVHFPRKRLGQPEQMDSTLLYLVSPSSEVVTGTVIKVDDGQGPR